MHCNTKIDKVLPTPTNSRPKDRLAPVCLIVLPCRLAQRGKISCPERQPSLLHNKSKMVVRQKKFSSNPSHRFWLRVPTISVIDLIICVCDLSSSNQGSSIIFFDGRHALQSLLKPITQSHYQSARKGCETISRKTISLSLSQQEESATQSHEKLSHYHSVGKRGCDTISRKTADRTLLHQLPKTRTAVTDLSLCVHINIH